MRTKQCRLIGRAVCDAVRPVRLQLDICPAVWFLDNDEETYDPAKLNAFAFSEGFSDWRAMVAFWAAEHPTLPVFSGVLITWCDFEAPAA
jgi:hypothetical protein